MEGKNPNRWTTGVGGYYAGTASYVNIYNTLTSEPVLQQNVSWPGIV